MSGLIGSPSRRGELLELVRPLFRGGPAGDVRVGLEAEVIPLYERGHAPALPGPSAAGEGTLALLREVARRRSWIEEPTPAGVPRFTIRDRGIVSYEPGGQIEFSTRPHRSLDELDRSVVETLEVLASAASARGIRLLARGLDPWNGPQAARMVLEGPRYPRQRDHYRTIGPLGEIMMLQSAALHVNLDPGPEPVPTWEAANTLVPHIITLFANAPGRHGAAVPHRSHRSALWRGLDPARTGAFPPSRDPADRYLDFALEAPSFLLEAPDGHPRPFGWWLERGEGGPAPFRAHLSTLFPEVRPRGYLEVRSVDALPARWCVVPGALLRSLLHHPPTRDAIRAELPVVTQDRMRRAGQAGLGDPELAGEVAWLTEQVGPAMHALPRGVATAAVRRRVEDFLDSFTAAGGDPAASPSSWVED